MLLGTYSSVFKTPLGAFTTLFPLAVVLTISMIQEGLADIKRHRADEEVRLVDPYTWVPCVRRRRRLVYLRVRAAKGHGRGGPDACACGRPDACVCVLSACSG